MSSIAECIRVLYKEGVNIGKIKRDLGVQKGQIDSALKSMSHIRGVGIHFGDKDEPYYDSDFPPKPSYSPYDLTGIEAVMLENHEPWDALKYSR